MNGYAAVNEPATEIVQADGTSSVVEVTGTVHAAETGAGGQAPGPYTLCGLDTDDLRKTPHDRPGGTSGTWYPPGAHIRSVCPVCDRLATGS